MILKKLSEARTPNANADLIKEIKEKDSRLASLRDTTIANIVKIFKDDSFEELTADNLISWFNESETLADFVFDYGESLFTYSICDFAEHDEKLLKAIKKLLQNYDIIDSEGHDLTTHYDPDEPRKSPKVLTPLEMCSIVFDYWTEVGERHDNVDSLPPSELSDKSHKSPEKLAKVLKELRTVYYTLRESITEEESSSEEIETPEVPEVSEMPAEPEIPEIPNEPSEQIQQTAFSEMLNSAIQEEWNFISSLNGIIATFDFEYKEENKEDIINILNQLVDDTTINIGMLHKAAELVSTKTTELLDAGQEKAEDIISAE